MWQLETYRIIKSIGGWMVAGEYATADLALDAIIGAGYALDYRIKSPTGDYHAVDWADHTDSMGCDYCLPLLGEVCTEWKQVIGNVR